MGSTDTDKYMTRINEQISESNIKGKGEQCSSIEIKDSF